jgi:hypothetical protein
MLVPWHCQAAIDASANITNLVVLEEARYSAAAIANGERRDTSVRKLFQSSLSSGQDYRLLGFGAYEQVARSDSADWEVSILGYKVVADTAAIRKTAEDSSRTEPKACKATSRGAWLCLLGQRDAGLAELKEEKIFTQEYSSQRQWDTDRLGLVACGGVFRNLHPSGSGLATLLVQQSGEWQTPAKRREALGVIDHGGFDPGNQVQVILKLAGSAKSVTVEDVSVFRHNFRSLPTAWRALSSHPDIALLWLEPDLLELAAKNLLEREEPALRQAGQFILLHAAIGYSRRAQYERAKAALSSEQAASSQKGKGSAKADLQLGLLAGMAHMAAQDPAGADLRFSSMIQDPGFSSLEQHVRSTALLNRALALASLKQYHEGYLAASQAQELAAGDEDWARWTQLPRTQLVRAALGLMAGVKEPVDGTGSLLSDVASLPDTRRAMRMRMGLGTVREWGAYLGEESASEYAGLAMGGYDRLLAEPVHDVLPAVIYLAGRFADGDGDTEVWLDYFFAEVHLKQGRNAPLARAEAARWRGDGAAADKWEERGRRLQMLVKDASTERLAWIVGI